MTPEKILEFNYPEIDPEPFKSISGSVDGAIDKPIDLNAQLIARNKEDASLGLPVVAFSSEVKQVAYRMECNMGEFPGSDPRKEVLLSILHSGSMVAAAKFWSDELAKIGRSDSRPLDGSIESIEQAEQEYLEKRRDRRLKSELETQQILQKAGIKDNATAIAWLESVSEGIDRDIAELEKLEVKYWVRRRLFFESKGAASFEWDD